LRDFLSIHTQDMDLASAVFVKQIFESVYLFLNNPALPGETLPCLQEPATRPYDKRNESR
jgi:hypothetical protein